MEIAGNYFSEITPSEDVVSYEKNVLIVEDDPFWQRVISRNIERTGKPFRISIATSANEAIGMLGIGQRFSLIVADNYLEGDKTGYELWLDCKKRGINVPFLLTSGKVDFPADIIKELPVKFVSKPFVSAELRRTLADLMSQDSSERFFEKSPLEWLDEHDRRIERTLIFVVLTLIAVSVFLGLNPPSERATEVLPPSIMAPPPPIKAYGLPSHVARALKLRDPPVSHDVNTHALITPGIAMCVERIVKREDEILSMIRQQSEFTPLLGPIFERSE